MSRPGGVESRRRTPLPGALRLAPDQKSPIGCFQGGRGPAKTLGGPNSLDGPWRDLGPGRRRSPGAEEGGSLRHPVPGPPAAHPGLREGRGVPPQRRDPRGPRRRPGSRDSGPPASEPRRVYPAEVPKSVSVTKGDNPRASGFQSLRVPNEGRVRGGPDPRPQRTRGSPAGDAQTEERGTPRVTQP